MIKFEAIYKLQKTKSMKKISILLTGLAFSIGFGQADNMSLVGHANSYTQTTDGTEDACSQDFTGGDLTLANSISGDFGYMVANDFDVEAGTVFTVTNIKPLLLPLAMGADDIGLIEAHIFEDNAGTPGTLVTIVDLEMVSSSQHPDTFAGYPMFEMDYAPMDVLELQGGDSGTKYWLGLNAYSNSGQNIFWVGAVWDTSSTSETNYQTADGGSTWTQVTHENYPGEFFESEWVIEGDCSVMGVADFNAAALAIYPNPANDVINVSLKNAEVKSISIVNLSGQVVGTSRNNSTINVATLPAGVYVVKVLDSKGATHTTKVVVK